MVREGLYEDMMVKLRRQTEERGHPPPIILSLKGSGFQAEGTVIAEALRLGGDPGAGRTVRILLLCEESVCWFDLISEPGRT